MAFKTENRDSVGPTMVGSTPWVSVLLAVGAGMLAAFQVGKVHIALPSIRQSLSLSLYSASWVLSALSVVGLFLAGPAGSISARIGTRRALIFGLLLVAAASGLGASAVSAPWLVGSRLLEGIGYVLILVAAPSLIVEIAQPGNLKLALAAWSAYMPGGVALITVLAPLILTGHTWRRLWTLNAALICVYAAVVALAMRHRPRTVAQRRPMKPFQELRTVLSSPQPLMLALIFATYTLQHLGVMGFLPTLLMEKHGVSPALAGILVSVAMASNILGNLAAGLLLQQGVRRSLILGGGSLFLAVMSIGIFSLGLSLVPVYICAFLFSCVGGVVPSAVMGAAPYHAPSASLIPATNGLLVQGSNLGIVLGPPLLSAIAARFGWFWVPVAVVPASLLAIAMASVLHRSAHSRVDFMLDSPMH